VTYQPQHDEIAADLQARLDRTMLALRLGPFAGMDEDRVRRMLGGMEE
jgi:hypothetical protein